MNSTIIARYPFLSSSKELVGGGLPSELDVREALFFAKETFEKKVHYGASAEREAKSLVIARLLLYSLGAYYLRKFAFLKSREYSRLFESEDQRVLNEIALDFFPSLEPTPDGFKVSVLDYLQYGRNLPEAGVEKGMVFFGKSELMECLRAAVQVRISDADKLDARLPENLKNAAAKLKEELKPFVERDFALRPGGKYLQKPELQNILKGVGEGKRYYGAMALAIACVKDGLEKDQALEVMQHYVENCAKGAHPFSQGEGQSVVEWVYRHPAIGFSFTMLKTQGLA